MSRLTMLNLLGVVCLSCLCVSQWQANRDANVKLRATEGLLAKLQGENAAQMKEQAAMTRDIADALDSSQKSSEQLKSAEQRLNEQDRLISLLRQKNAQVKNQMSNWIEATQLRDGRLKQAAGEFSKIIHERDEIANRFNDLAAKYNQLVRTNTAGDLSRKTAETLTGAVAKTE